LSPIYSLNSIKLPFSLDGKSAQWLLSEDSLTLFRAQAVSCSRRRTYGNAVLLRSVPIILRIGCIGPKTSYTVVGSSNRRHHVWIRRLCPLLKTRHLWWFRLSDLQCLFWLRRTFCYTKEEGWWGLSDDCLKHYKARFVCRLFSVNQIL